MKILLAAVNAKYIHSNLAVYCLRAYAKEQHPASDITISEYTINQISKCSSRVRNTKQSKNAI